MNHKQFIENLETGQPVDEAFYVEEKNLNVSRGGKPYLDMKLRDRTGNISAKVWERAEEVSKLFSRGDFIRATGIVKDFREKPQLNVDMVHKLEPFDVDRKDFIMHLDEESTERYFKKFMELLDEVENPHIKALLDSFFLDEEFVRLFKECPAAANIHHNFLGGLLKHTFTMLVIARFLAKVIYKDVDYAILAAGIVLHDIGKVRELETKMAIEYSDEGHLLGHAIIGIDMVRERIRGIEDFPSNLEMLIEHILLSHHGIAEFGALRAPLFKEAMLVHLVDTIDSKMEIMDKALKKVEHGEHWSERCWPIDNKKLLKIDEFLLENESGL